MARFHALPFALALLALPAHGQWDNLNRITHGKNYDFILRGGSCVSGQIREVTADSVLVKPRRTFGIPSPLPIRIMRAQVLRVADYVKVEDVVYTARSSWSELGAMKVDPREHLRVITKGGERIKGGPEKVSTDRLLLKSGSKLREIMKSDVSQVYYARVKPINHDIELFVFDPRVWPYWLHIDKKLPVLIYDASVPEDSTPVPTCNWTYR